MIFKTTTELKSYLISHTGNAIRKATEQVYQVINRFVKEFYADYTPEMYDRTYQLYSSLVKSDIEFNGNGWEAVVYFDYSSLIYNTGVKPSGYQVVEAAAHGRHGVNGENVIQRNTGIWDDPMELLKSKSGCFEILKKMLISEGIPVR